MRVPAHGAIFSRHQPIALRSPRCILRVGGRRLQLLMHGQKLTQRC